MTPFVRSLRQAQILILERLNASLWLKFSPSLTSNKIEPLETVSTDSLFANRGIANQQKTLTWME
jgi:hypothetical protein